ncbi:ABC transporter permease [Pseudogracilibacillus auburnensis]|uniref:Transport permease protein n=1 Tax=Pseudogracilibacillus auburnensis TaxID=1494959 RepID=A0A2V3WC00_9BACI|nr:ABC transporter permease [Pseudogracilibacillus auburnensis]MBO1001239.1 ABC transporter permease [Pseudogracilibacillus auburnensis]PXW90674.1 ABC-2 type transport system permease protein [Pseudogracilibacillus auburnensis]
MNMLTHSWYMTLRHLRNTLRMPFVIFMNLIQPIIWLFLFSSLFSSIIHIPGFNSNSYINYLAPGIVIMSTFMAGSYAGMSMIADHNHGVLNRFLTSPVKRSALILGPLIQNAVTMIIQATIMILLSFMLGANFAGGLVGIFILIICGVMVGIGFGALSLSIALLVRNEQALMAFVGFISMPVMFLSSLFMPLQLVPDWIHNIARFNPVNWAGEAGREAIKTNIDWGIVLTYSGYLLIFSILSILLATLSFRKYQKTI